MEHYTAHDASDYSIETLVSLMREHSWVGLWQKFTQRGALVCDADFRAAYKKMYAFSKITLMTIEEAESLSSISGKLFVFTKKNELGLVRRLRNKLGKGHVLSVTYEFLPASIRRPFKMSKITRKGVFNMPQKPVVIISTPGSDVSYLDDLMAETGLANPVEHFTRLLVQIIAYKEKVHLQRLFSAIIASDAEQSQFATILYSDVLQQFVELGAVTKEQIRQYLEDTDAQVLYFLRRDKLVQSSMCVLLESLPARSIDRVKKSKTISGRLETVNFAAAYEFSKALIEDELWIEDFLSEYSAMKMITLEDLVMNTSSVLTHLGQFLNMKPKLGKEISSYADGYKEMQQIVDQVVLFKRELIDRLGLHVNSHGSLTSKSEEIFHHKR